MRMQVRVFPSENNLTQVIHYVNLKFQEPTIGVARGGPESMPPKNVSISSHFVL